MHFNQVHFFPTTWILGDSCESEKTGEKREKTMRERESKIQSNWYNNYNMELRSNPRERKRGGERWRDKRDGLRDV